MLLMRKTSRQRVLIITRNLPPLVGGMERLNWHMADELSKYAEVHIIGPQGAAGQKPPNVKLTQVPLKPLPLFLIMAFIQGLWQTITWKPDTILAGSGLTAPAAWLLGALGGAKSAAYLHGFDVAVANSIYRSVWRPTFKKLDRVIVNSTPTRHLTLSAAVPDEKISTVFPGTTLPQAEQPQDQILSFKRKHGLEGKKIMLSVGRLTTRKGLREFVSLSLPAIIAAEPDAILVIVGEAPKHSLGAGIQSQESILAAAKAAGVESHLKFLGVITDKTELATAYEAATVHVFPVRQIHGDPEGFGMVAIEAAAHGIPTVAFATGGIVDAVLDAQSGYLITEQSYPALAAEIKRVLEGQRDWQSSCQRFAKEFEWLFFGAKIAEALELLPKSTRRD